MNLQKHRFNWIACKNRDEASHYAASIITRLLRLALGEEASANLLVSGGNTPKRTFALLSEQKLGWAKVRIGLVDERAVPMTHDASNAKLVRETLLCYEAKNALFFPMICGNKITATPTSAIEDHYASMLPAHICLLGMGEDGHTASWFPGSSDLPSVFKSPKYVEALNARNCPVAGNTPERITLTRKAIAQSHKALLLLFGNTKKDVFEASLESPAEAMPISAVIDDLGSRLTVVWAP